MAKKRATYQWVPESIRGYKPLYKGLHYWVFLNDKDCPFEGWTKDSDVIAYDLYLNWIMAVGKYNDDGVIEGCYMGGQGVTFHADNAKDMVAECLSIQKWYY